jgi:hypothetical protein
MPEENINATVAKHNILRAIHVTSVLTLENCVCYRFQSWRRKYDRRVCSNYWIASGIVRRLQNARGKYQRYRSINSIKARSVPIIGIADRERTSTTF